MRHYFALLGIPGQASFMPRNSIHGGWGVVTRMPISSGGGLLPILPFPAAADPGVNAVAQ
jgi:hypothetical protein